MRIHLGWTLLFIVAVLLLVLLWASGLIDALRRRLPPLCFFVLYLLGWLCSCLGLILSCFQYGGLLVSALVLFSSLAIFYKMKQIAKFSKARFNGNSFQLIDENRNLDDVGLDNLLEKAGVLGCGDSYDVVSIIGPQSSGKSTLINHLFGTYFKEMDASKGRSQTTKGIWMANCAGIRSRTIVMDVEGCDGRERGEDDMLFEKQLALFSLVSSKTVMLNIFYTSVGLNSGASKPLLRIVFQEMIKMSNPNKVTLILVIRDRDRLMPFEFLENDLKKDIAKMWESITAPSGQKALLNDFFQVEVVALASYGLEKKQFKIDVANLKSKFFNSTSSRGHAQGRKTLITASGYSAYVQSLWKTIKENKDLDIPSHRLLVATAQCEKIAEETLTWFSEHKKWIKIQKSVECGLVEGFGNKVGSLLKTCLTRFDERAEFYDENVRTAKHTDLETRALQYIKPTWEQLGSHIISKVVETFKEDFNKAVKSGKKDLERASSDCIQSAYTQFDTRCADAVISQEKWDTQKFKGTLKSQLDDHVKTIATQEKDKEAVSIAQKEKADIEAKHNAVLEEKQGADRTNQILQIVDTSVRIAGSLISVAGAFRNWKLVPNGARRI